MKKIKKLSLNKEKIVNLNDSSMSELKGGASSSFVCSYLGSKVVDYTVEVTESWMKDNTLWVACTTDPNRSQQYGTPGCIAP